MENKEIIYYTPKQEDFYLGYKYELFEDFDHLPEPIWHKLIYGENGTDNPENMTYPFSLTMKNVRTKYLDTSDIESLGWVKMNNIGKNTQHIIPFRKGEWHINFIEDSPIEIFNNDETMFFKGKCPSINELITIQRLLGVE